MENLFKNCEEHQKPDIFLPVQKDSRQEPDQLYVIPILWKGCCCLSVPLLRLIFHCGGVEREPAHYYAFLHNNRVEPAPDLYSNKDQGWEFAHSLIAHLLISLKSN